MRRAHLLFAAMLALILGGCTGYQTDMDRKFGDQHFKTTIALIELHKIRFGQYPEKLSDLRYTGEWDAIALNSVEYRRVPNGYELNVVRGWMGQPDLRYPPEFWHGLGIVKSNVKRQE